MIDLLKVCSIFDECTEQQMAEIAKFCQMASFSNNQRIFEAESRAEFLYIVVEGAIELRFKVTHFTASKEIILDRKFKGDFFGWSATTEPYVYTLSAVTMNDSKLVKIMADDIKALCEKDNRLGYLLMKNICEVISERLSAMQRILMDMVRERFKEKEI
jgi:CRP-like cAMP-binding protein